jgi:hypothetical protein
LFGNRLCGVYSESVSLIANSSLVQQQTGHFTSKRGRDASQQQQQQPHWAVRSAYRSVRTSRLDSAPLDCSAEQSSRTTQRQSIRANGCASLWFGSMQSAAAAAAAQGRLLLISAASASTLPVCNAPATGGRWRPALHQRHVGKGGGHQDGGEVSGLGRGTRIATELSPL